MLQSVMDAVGSHPEIKEVTLHVHTANEDAQTFYTRAGFEKGELIERYYRGITPPDAYVFRRRVNGGVAAAAAAAGSAVAAPVAVVPAGGAGKH